MFRSTATWFFNDVKFISVRAESFPVSGAVESGTGTGGGDGAGDQTQSQDTSGEARPTLTSRSINLDLRERRFGLLQRVLQMSSTTKVRVFYFNEV